MQPPSSKTLPSKGDLPYLTIWLFGAASALLFGVPWIAQELQGKHLNDGLLFFLLLFAVLLTLGATYCQAWISSHWRFGETDTGQKVRYVLKRRESTVFAVTVNPVRFRSILTACVVFLTLAADWALAIFVMPLLQGKALFLILVGISWLNFALTLLLALVLAAYRGPSKEISPDSAPLQEGEKFLEKLQPTHPNSPIE